MKSDPLKKLSPTMLEAYFYAKEHGGKLKRMAGGSWVRSDWCAYDEQSFRTTTIEALVRRKVATYSNRRAYARLIDGKTASFPVEITIIEAHGGNCEIS